MDPHRPEFRLQAVEPLQVEGTLQADDTPQVDLHILGATGIIPQFSPFSTLPLTRGPLRKHTHTALRRVLTALTLDHTLLKQGGHP